MFCFGQDLAERWGQNKQIPATRYADWLAKREKDSKPQLTHGNDGAPAPDAEDASADKNAAADENLEPAGAAS